MRYTKKRNNRAIKSEINIVPLLDVLLVLLLTFMAVAPIINQSVEVDLPQTTDAKTVTPSEERPPVILEVAGINQYAMLIKNERKNQMTTEDVIAEAKELLAQNPKTIFLIGGAKDVPYDEVIKALNMLKTAGVNSVGLMVQPLS